MKVSSDLFGDAVPRGVFVFMTGGYAGAVEFVVWEGAQGVMVKRQSCYSVVDGRVVVNLAGGGDAPEKLLADLLNAGAGLGAIDTTGRQPRRGADANLVYTVVLKDSMHGEIFEVNTGLLDEKQLTHAFFAAAKRVLDHAQKMRRTGPPTPGR